MTLEQFNRIVEIRTKIISMGTFLSASMYAALHTSQWSWKHCIVMLIAVLCVDMGTTGFNSYFDYTSGTDTKEYNLEKDKVLVHQGVSPLLALGISLTLFGIAGMLGLLLAWWTSWKLLFIGAVSMSIGFIYTGGPFPISRTPVGELFAGGFLGTILFLITTFVLTLSVTVQSFIVSIPHMLLIGLILTVNNTCDKVADIVAGRKTLTILLPEKINLLMMKGVLVISYLLPVLYAVLHLVPLYIIPLTLIALVLSLRIFSSMEKRGFSLATKGLSMGSISQIFLLYCTSFILSHFIQLIT